ncbi:MAG: NAD(+) synthase, partial [Gemmatimonadota bacterium]|nr:NAD(+) synthase [Gemmatimonadota bacterium]
LGYGTLFGDLASAVNPLGNLYKTQVRALAEHLGIPERIRTKAPSADLWEGQEDEDELGGSYEEYDRLLYDLVERKIPPEEMIARGTNAEFLRATTERIRRYRYKGRLPRIARVEQVAPNSPPAASPDKE